MTNNPSSAFMKDQVFFRYLIAFFSGFTAVLLFHQGILSILHAVGFTPVAPFPTQVTKPFGLPQIWSLAFWGGSGGSCWRGWTAGFPEEPATGSRR